MRAPAGRALLPPKSIAGTSGEDQAYPKEVLDRRLGLPVLLDS
jgi:hypothetical protein